MYHVSTTSAFISVNKHIYVCIGRDPKYFFPVKLDKSMVDAMGGFESKYYKEFKIFCCEAFNILRRNADLILSLFHMMALSSINR